MESEKVSYYSYSAADNNEIKRIREKYAPTESKNIKLEQLRALDKSVHTVASTFSIAAGVIGLLIFGFALTCVLEWSEKFFALGVASGLVGLILIISAMRRFILFAFLFIFSCDFEGCCFGEFFVTDYDFIYVFE